MYYRPLTQSVDIQAVNNDGDYLVKRLSKKQAKDIFAKFDWNMDLLANNIITRKVRRRNQGEQTTVQEITILEPKPAPVPVPQAAQTAVDSSIQISQSILTEGPTYKARKNDVLKDIFFGSEIQNEARRVRKAKVNA